MEEIAGLRLIPYLMNTNHGYLGHQIRLRSEKIYIKKENVTLDLVNVTLDLVNYTLAVISGKSNKDDSNNSTADGCRVHADSQNSTSDERKR